jgi:hypothetical protein
MLFPIFGAGQAGEDPEDAIGDLIKAVVAHFKRTPDTTVSRVYFLAFTDQDKDVCTRVLENMPGLSARKGCPAIGAAKAKGKRAVSRR